MSLEFQLAWPTEMPEMGVYEIRCTSTGHVYVGQSRRLRRRWLDHIKELKTGRGCPRLQKVWNQHGVGSFTFRVLEVVTDGELLAEREQHYIDTLDACGPMGLNTLPHAGSFEGYTPDAEARAKIGAATRKRLTANPDHQPKMVEASKACGYTPSARHRRRIGAAHKQLWAEGVQVGHPRSQECREKISEALQGRKSPTEGKPRSDETKRKIGAANRGKTWSEKQRSQREGVPLTDDHKQKMSVVRKGVPWTPARREAEARRKVEKSQ